MSHTAGNVREPKAAIILIAHRPQGLQIQWPSFATSTLKQVIPAPEPCIIPTPELR